MNIIKTMNGVFDHSTDGYILVNPDGLIKYANPAVSDLLGYRHGSLLFTSVEELIPERLRDIHREHRKKYNENPAFRPMGESVHLNIVVLHKDGTEIKIAAALSPVIVKTKVYTIVRIRPV